MSAPQQIASFIGETNAAGRHTYQNDPWEAASTDEEKRDGWLLSYIDILTIFLTLFAVLLVLQPKGEEQANVQDMPAIHIHSLEHSRGNGAAHTPAPESLARVTISHLERPAILPAIQTETASETAPKKEPVVRLSTLAENRMTAQESDGAKPPASVKSEPATALGNNALNKGGQTIQIGSVINQDRVTENKALVEHDATSRIAIPSPEGSSNIDTEVEQERQIDHILARLTSHRWSERLEVSRIAEGVSLEVRDNILFAPGKAVLKPEGLQLLAELAEILSTHAGIISIEGHTDNRPIANQRFPSNWELSSGRATMVARHLINQGLTPTKLRAVGYADTRPRESNLNPEGRARNRRVALILHFPEEKTDPE